MMSLTYSYDIGRDVYPSKKWRAVLRITDSGDDVGFKRIGIFATEKAAASAADAHFSKVVRGCQNLGRQIPART